MNGRLFYCHLMVNHGYRRHLKQDTQLVQHGIDPHEFRTDTFVSLMRVFRDKVRLSTVRASVTPLMHFVYENFERSASRLDLTILACRRGCSHCCQIWTDAYAPEVFFAAKQMAGSRDEALIDLVTRIGEFSARVSFDQRDTFPIPCGLLVDNSCSIYRFRPLNCRTAISLDEEACRKAFLENVDEEIPVAPGWSNLGQVYSMALKGALFHAGLSCDPFEWNSGLDQAICEPDLEKRWLAGEAVLENSPIATPAAPFSHPFWKGLYDRAFSD